MQRKIRWAILGTGVVARAFAHGLSAVSEVELTAVGSRTRSNAAAFARVFAIPHIHASYEDLVADEAVDVVYVASPPAVHRDHCLLALCAGKAVLCEKPFTTTATEAKEVVATARSARLFCMEAMWMRFLPVMRQLRQVLDRGTIGEIRLLFADLGFPAPYEPSSRLLDPKLGGGAFFDLGVYLLSLAFFVLGRPDRVVALATVGPTGVDEDSAAVLRYPGGRLAVLTASLRSELPGEGLIVGTRGHVRIHPALYRPHRLSIRTHPERRSGPAVPASAGIGLLARSRNSWLLRSFYFRLEGLLRPILGGRLTSIVAPFVGNGYNYEIAEVVRCLRAGEVESPVMPLDETVAITEVVDQIRESWVVRSDH